MAEVDTLNFELRIVGQSAIKKALTKLRKIAGGDQRVSSVSVSEGGGKATKSKTMAADDLEAAKALAKFGIDALKLARTGVPRDPGAGKKDLFDDAETANPWDLRKIE
jgi:hypothetical protein